MSVYKDNKTNTWRVIYRYTDWTGEQKQSSRRGFASKHEAQAWEREQMNKVTADLDMSFDSFVEHYTEDLKTRLKENTWSTKDHIIRTKLIPYFGKLKMCAVTPQIVMTWQNEMLRFLSCHLCHIQIASNCEYIVKIQRVNLSLIDAAPDHDAGSKRHVRVCKTAHEIRHQIAEVGFIGTDRTPVSRFAGAIGIEEIRAFQIHFARIACQTLPCGVHQRLDGSIRRYSALSDTRPSEAPPASSRPLHP